MGAWAVSAIATLLFGVVLFGGYAVVTPAVLDVAMVGLAASGSHVMLGLLDGPD